MNHFPSDPHNELTRVPESIDRVVVIGDPSPANCPKCHATLVLAEVDDHPVLFCGECCGLLIQSRIFSEVVTERRKKYTGPEAVPTVRSASDLERKICCPGCHQPMETHPYHGPGNTVIDSCIRCWLTFLDYGELNEIERAPGRRN